MAGYKDRKGNSITLAEAIQEQLHGRPVMDGTTNQPITVDVSGTNSAKTGYKQQASYGFGGSVVQKSANATVVAGEGVYQVDASGGAVTITLPTPVGAAGRSVLIVRTNSGANAVTVTTPAGSILGPSLTGASRTLGAQGASITVVSDGSNWIIQQLLGTVS